MTSSLQQRPNRALLSAGMALVFATAAAAQTQSYDGLEQRCQFGAAPPQTPSQVTLDTPTASIANNYNWIVEVCNSQIAAYQKNGSQSWRNNLSGDFLANSTCGTTTSFFGPTATRIVDTKVLCDRNSSRFCVIGMQQDTFAPGTQGLYIAWSDNSDPYACHLNPTNGGWHTWSTPMPNGFAAPGAYQPDFNGMGQTDTHIVWSGILQPLTGGQPFTLIRIISKAHMSTLPGTLQYVDIVSPTTRPTSEFMHAADTFDPIAGIYLASVLVNTGNQLRIVRANLGTNPPSEDQFLLTVPPFQAPSPAPQMGGTFLDTIDGRMQGAVVRDGFLYCCHTIHTSSTSPNLVRWYQIALNGWPNGTPTLVQSGNIDLGLSPGGQRVHTFMPALAVNGDGAMFVTYAQSALDQPPRIGWSARRGISPAGTLPQTGTVTLVSPVAYTTSNGVPGAANVHRWGDWSSAVVDLAAPTLRFLACGSYGKSGPPSGNPSGVCNALITMPNHWATRWQSINVVDSPWSLDYGVGSPGTGAVIPDLVSCWPRPRLGQTSAVNVTNTAGVPTLGVGMIALNPAPGFPISGVSSPFGMLWVDVTQVIMEDFVLNVSNGSYPLAVPIDPAFIGAPLYLQAGVLDSGAAQGIALTDALQVIVGS